MATLTNTTSSNLYVGSIFLAPGVPTDVDDFDRLKTTGAVPAWLKSGVITTDAAATLPDEARKARFDALSEGLSEDDLTEAGLPKLNAINALLEDDEAKFTADERDSFAVED